MTQVTMRQMLEAGLHFGHQTRRWNPKMKQFIWGARNGIHIIDLQHTVKMFKRAFDAIIEVTARGDLVLFVGTKKQAQDVIRDEAARAGQLYVTQRNLGSVLYQIGATDLTSLGTFDNGYLSGPGAFLGSHWIDLTAEKFGALPEDGNRQPPIRHQSFP